MGKSMPLSFLLAAVAASFCWASAWAGAPAAGKATLPATKGKITTDAGGVATADATARLDIGPVPAGPYRIEAAIQLSDQAAPNDGALVLTDPKDPQSVLARIGGRDLRGRHQAARNQRQDNVQHPHRRLLPLVVRQHCALRGGHGVYPPMAGAHRAAVHEDQDNAVRQARQNLSGEARAGRESDNGGRKSSHQLASLACVGP